MRNARDWMLTLSLCTLHPFLMPTADAGHTGLLEDFPQSLTRCYVIELAGLGSPCHRSYGWTATARRPPAPRA